MAREWDELFVVPGADPASAARARSADSESSPGGLFARLRHSLAKTRQALGAEIQDTLAQALDDASWERLEEALIMADVGAATTAEVVGRLEREAREQGIEGGEALTARLAELLAELARVGDDRIELTVTPTVILVVGVNGTGKTTTVGKLAWQLRQRLDRRVLLGAADTFRAAGSEQLEQWGERAGCPVVTGAAGADPGSVAYETLAAARADGCDVALIDTAGRLHTQDDLMAELGKVRRVLAKQMPGAPHETLLVIDATTGQNGLRQARLFADAAEVTGIVLTKLDGSAKGGIALAIAGELGIPVKLIGTGEGLEDLRPFDPDDFARALLR